MTADDTNNHSIEAEETASTDHTELVDDQGVTEEAPTAVADSTAGADDGDEPADGAEPPTGEVSAPAASETPWLWLGGIVVLVAVVVFVAIKAVAQAHTASLATPTSVVPPLQTPAPAATPVISGGSVAVVVNGEKIPMSTFRIYFNLDYSRSNQPGAPPQPASQIAAQTMNQLIEQALFNQYARAHHLTVSQAELNQRLQAEYKQNGGKAAFERQIKSLGLDLNTAINYFVKPSLLFEKVVNSVAPLPKTVPQAKVQHLLISLHPQGKPARSDAQARALAQNLLKQIQHGANFTALIKKYSDDPGKTTNKGIYTVLPGEMVAPFEHAAYTLPLNKPSIVKTQFGYHIVDVLARANKATSSLSATDRQQLQQTQQTKANTWVQNQMRKATIKRIAQVKG